MWSAAGISAVDMTASYYFDDGYWNGNVWMSHQFFMWKTMFDLGETEFAFEIARRALDMWKEETDFSYNTYECFGIQTRRGGWFPISAACPHLSMCGRTVTIARAPLPAGWMCGRTARSLRTPLRRSTSVTPATMGSMPLCSPCRMRTALGWARTGLRFAQ